MSMHNSVTAPVSESVTLKLGKNVILRLRDLAVKESIRRMAHVTMADLIKESLKNTFPVILTE